MESNLVDAKVHPAFLRFIEICKHINFGTIERLEIQNGLPVFVEVVENSVVQPKIVKKIKLV